MTSQPGFLAKWLPSPKLILGMSAMSVPVAYILKKHLDWKPRPDSKKRMLIHHGVFWASGIPTLKFLHKAWGEFQRGGKPLELKKEITGKVPAGSSLKVAGWFAAATGTLIGGFEGGGRLAKALVPKPPKPMTLAPGNAPMSINALSPTYAQPSASIAPTSPHAARPIPMTYSPFTYPPVVVLR
jgi:hypothetical protein